MNRDTRTLLLASLALVALIGCSDDDTVIPPPPSDTTSPTISSVTTIDVRHIQIVFSEPVTRRSATNHQHYYLSDGAVGVVAASLLSDNQTVMLSTRDMSAITYRLDVKDVYDIHGNISAPSSTDVLGSIQNDNTAPEIVFQYPAPGAVDVSPTTRIEFSLSEAYVPGLWIETKSSGGAAISSTFNSDFANVRGSAELWPGQTCIITLHNVVDLAGNRLPDPTWSFTVKSEEQ